MDGIVHILDDILYGRIVSCVTWSVWLHSNRLSSNRLRLYSASSERLRYSVETVSNSNWNRITRAFQYSLTTKEAFQNACNVTICRSHISNYYYLQNPLASVARAKAGSHCWPLKPPVVSTVPKRVSGLLNHYPQLQVSELFFLTVLQQLKFISAWVLYKNNSV